MGSEKMCVCGDTEEQHIDGMEQCVVPECGCKEFEEPATEQEKKVEREFSPKQEEIIEKMKADTSLYYTAPTDEAFEEM